MLYAKVVVGLPVEGPFDYIVPAGLERAALPGCRVKVFFGPRKITGYIVGLSRKSRIKKLKSIVELLDPKPLLDKNMLSLTGELAAYYCSSWGEMIESALPEPIRQGRKVGFTAPVSQEKEKSSALPLPLLLHSLDSRLRWDLYLEKAKEALDKGKSVLLLLPDKEAAGRAAEVLSGRFNRQVSLLYRKGPKELEEWCKARSGEASIVVGTISAVFAPMQNLGLIILEQEEDFAYKQDQVPHYHARQAVFMRSRSDKAELILGAVSPSLEAIYLCRKGKVQYRYIPPAANLPEVKTVDLRFGQGFAGKKGAVFSKYLLDALSLSLGAKEKVLLLMNRKGFATSSTCNSCGAGLRCPRCDINLVYHFSKNMLSCNYCSFKMAPPKICPSCNAGYLTYSGLGTEKAESELARIFPQARIKALGEPSGDADIFVSTGAQARKEGTRFSLVAVLGIDNLINRVDFRASERAFSSLLGFLPLAEKRLLVQTALGSRPAFVALQKNDFGLFYDEELKQRKQLGFPPFRHMILIKARAQNESRAREAAEQIHKIFSDPAAQRVLKVISLNAADPHKLRGNYYWQVIFSASNVKRASGLIKSRLRSVPRSGAIVTVDVDPL